MANKPLQTIKFPGLTDTYTVPQVDSNFVGTAGQVPDSKKVHDEIDSLKEDLNITSKLAGIVVPYNIFDKTHVESGFEDGWIKNKVINESTGELEDTTTTIACTYLIPVYNKHKISMKYGSGQIIGTLRHIAAYDENGTFMSIAGINLTEWKLPAGACYVRIEHTYGGNPSKLSNDVTVCDDTTKGTAYQPYFTPYIDSKKDAYNSYDMLERFATFIDRTMNGVTYTWDKDAKTCKAVGTASAISVTNIYYNQTVLPTGIEAGKSYMFRVRSTDSKNLFLELNIYGSGDAQIVFVRSDTEILIPSDTVGLLMRIRTRTGSTVDASVMVDILNAKTNTELTEDIRTLRVRKDYVQIFPKFTTIGDSLMGGFMNRDGVSVTTETAKQAGNNWVNYLALRTGRTFTNLATGGSTAKQWRESLIDGANIATDAYIIGIGINDYRNSLTVGTSEDIAVDKADNADSFYGNYDFMVRQLMEWKPKAHIFCFTMPSQGGGGATGYNDAIKYITALYPEKVHCINLRDDYDGYFNAPIVADNYAGRHFNPISYNYMSSVVEMAINDYMESNNQLFATAPYA